MKIAVVFLTACVTAGAGSLGTSVFGQVDGFNNSGVYIAAACSNSGGASTACSDNHSNASIDLSSEAAFGALKARAIVSGTATQPNVSAESSFADMLTIATPGTSSGFVQYTFSMVGSAFSSDQGLVANFQQNGTSVGRFLPYPFGAGGLPIDESFTTTLAAFTSGTPVLLSVSTAVDTYLGLESGSYSVADSVQLTLTGFSVFDSSQHSISDYKVYSSSSTYGGLVTETPEPSTVVPMFLLGGALVLAKRWSRKAHLISLRKF